MVFLRQKFLEHVAQPCRHAVQIPRRQCADHAVDIRAVFRCPGIRQREQRRRGDAEFRLAQYDPTIRQGRQRRQPFPPALRQSRAAGNAEGHITAHRQSDGPQLLHGHFRRILPAQAPQQRRHIRAAAPQACVGRGGFFQMHGQGRHGPSDGGKKGFRRLLLQGGLPRRDREAVRQQCEAGASLLHRYCVAKGNGLHHHPQLVIAVRPAA